MSREQRHVFSIAGGLLLAAALTYSGLTQPHPAINPVAWLLFGGLFLFTDAFGFDTAVGAATDARDRPDTTAESHHQVMVLELMGRHAAGGVG